MNILQVLNERNNADKERIHLTTDGKTFTVLPLAVGTEKWYFQNRGAIQGHFDFDVVHVYRLSKCFFQVTKITMKSGLRKVRTDFREPEQVELFTTKTIQPTETGAIFERAEFWSGVMNTNELSKALVLPDFSYRKETTKKEVDILITSFFKTMFVRPIEPGQDLPTYFQKFTASIARI